MAQDPRPLSAPTNLSASISPAGIALSWTAPDGHVDGYEILRRRPLQGETELTTLVDDTGSIETSYTDTSATALGEQYVYRVKSIRGDERSELSEFVSVDFPTTPPPSPTPVKVSISCEMLAGTVHNILRCTASAGDLAITSAKWTPWYEVQYAQTTDGPVVAWVVAEEYCGHFTSVEVDALSDKLVLPSASAIISLECVPLAPTDTVTVSCENTIENSQRILRCALSGSDQTIDSAQWTPSYDVQSAQTTTGAEATEATWVISSEYCGQTVSMEVVPQAGQSLLPTAVTTFPLLCDITVDDNCSLANAIRSANGNAQVEESGDPDGNDDCEDGADPDDSATPPATGDDIILLTANTTLAASLPAITSRIQIEGGGHTISGDDKYQVFTVSGGQLSISDLTITKGFSSTVGGGIYLNSGSLSVSDSAIKNSNASDIGGGLYAIDSDVEIADTEISGNSTVKSHGGGIYFVSSTDLHTLNIVGATFKKNQSTEDGGALKTAGGIASVNKSTFVENTADEGGAIESSETTLDITNSTFSSNSAREGGGLSSFSSNVTLTHTTWAYNSAAEQGGGIAIIGWTGTFKIRNTLITGSTSGGDCHSGPNPNIIIEFTGNFIQDGSCAPQPAESQAASSDGESGQLQAQHANHGEPAGMPGRDPGISGLVGNPPHHPLQWGSLAIDAADPHYCLFDDQPDTARPQYGNCDIGAYEYPKAPPTPTPRPPTQAPPASPATDTPTPTPTSTTIGPPAATPTATDVAPTPTWSPDDCIHIVGEGENLFRIAILYNMTVREISSFNNLLNDHRLSEGQELIIPFDHCESPTPLKG